MSITEDARDSWGFTHDPADEADMYADSTPNVGGVGGIGGVGGLNRGVGGTVLESVREHLGRYLMPASEDDLDVLALWAVHTHLVRETWSSPRLLINSPVKGSGKTTVLEHLERLVPNATFISTVSSSALLPRIIAGNEDPTTLLIDEAEKSLNPNKPGIEDILAIINSGYKVGGTRPVLSPSKEGGWNVDNMSTFAPVAMAGNAPNLPDDTRDRCIEVLMFRADDGEVEETDWELLDMTVRDLGLSVAEWADQIRDSVKATRPDVPAGCSGRMKERWLPLKRVAVFAGSDWPERVDRLIISDIEQSKHDREEGLVTIRPHEHLITDIHAIFEKVGKDFLRTTTDILPLLASAHPDRWGEGSVFKKPITGPRLGKMLTSNYSIRSEKSPDAEQKRGYYRQQFVKAWRTVGIREA